MGRVQIKIGESLSLVSLASAYLLCFALLWLLHRIPKVAIGSEEAKVLGLPQSLYGFTIKSDGDPLDWNRVHGIVRLFLDENLAKKKVASHLALFYERKIVAPPSPALDTLMSLGIYRWNSENNKYDLIQTMDGFIAVPNNVIVVSREGFDEVDLVFTYVSGSLIPREIYRWDGEKFRLIYTCEHVNCSILVSPVMEDAIIEFKGGPAGDGYYCTLSIYQGEEFKEVYSYYGDSSRKERYMCLEKYLNLLKAESERARW